jgi:hypothetical protein
MQAALAYIRALLKCNNFIRALIRLHILVVDVVVVVVVVVVCSC